MSEAFPQAPTGLLAGFLTETEVAAEFKRCHRTIVRWRERGNGPPYIHLSRNILYRREAVAAHAKSGKALRKRRLASECENKRAACEGAAGYREPIVHWQKS